jgi:hypothetical protein
MGEEREKSSDSGGRERNMSLIPIQATKIGDISVKLFHLMRGVHIRCFFTLKFYEKNKSKL